MKERNQSTKSNPEEIFSEKIHKVEIIDPRWWFIVNFTFTLVAVLVSVGTLMFTLYPTLKKTDVRLSFDKVISGGGIGKFSVPGSPYYEVFERFLKIPDSIENQIWRKEHVPNKPYFNEAITLKNLIELYKHYDKIDFQPKDIFRHYFFMNNGDTDVIILDAGLNGILEVTDESGRKIESSGNGIDFGDSGYVKLLKVPKGEILAQEYSVSQNDVFKQIFRNISDLSFEDSMKKYNIEVNIYFSYNILTTNGKVQKSKLLESFRFGSDSLKGMYEVDRKGEFTNLVHDVELLSPFSDH